MKSWKTTFPGIAAAMHHSDASIYPDVFAKALFPPAFNGKTPSAVFDAWPRIRFQRPKAVIKL
ncbi:hypothetical protein [Rhizobium leguminosarum]|uniref:hypothetical protein n=1 Tax=Rhizobium leguminosarum TaxID=384 RepID=UPI000F77DC14|nr:hypothetical protein [Rhizobium leguminosarum]